MSSLSHQRVTSAVAFDPSLAAAVLQRARALAKLDGEALKLMKGKKLALLSPGQDDDDENGFVLAATALGAHVSRVRPGLDERSGERQIEATARMLTRLYDAVECQRLPGALVERIASNASIPVFAGLATQAHPSAQLASDLAPEMPPDIRRRCVIQAVLLLSVA